VKDEASAAQQYQALSEALVAIGAAWVVEEVDEIVALGKQQPFGDLPVSARRELEQRLADERAKGLRVDRPSPMDEIGNEYTASERLEILTDAAQQVISSTMQAREAVVAFARTHDVSRIFLVEPSRLEPLGGQRESRRIELESFPDDRLGPVVSLLRDRVLE
jgi:hypothetical protein